MCPFVRPWTRRCRALRTPYSCGTRPPGQSCLPVCLGARSSICQGRWRHTLWEDWKALGSLCLLLPHSLQPPENRPGIHLCAEPARAHRSLHLGEKEACYRQLACEPSGRSCGLGTPCAMPSQHQEGLGALALLSSPAVGERQQALGVSPARSPPLTPLAFPGHQPGHAFHSQDSHRSMGQPALSLLSLLFGKQTFPGNLNARYL